MNAAINSKMWWWVARSSGIVAWALVTASLLWGLALSTKLIRRRGVPAWLLALHRYLGALSVIFTGIHLLGLWADSYVTFGALELFVPFASGWKPFAVGVGVVAFYLLVAIEFTSLIMKHIPRKLWHAIHMSSFVSFVTATLHGFLAGTDRKSVVLQWLTLTGLTFVVFLVLFRWLSPKRVSPLERISSSATTRQTPPTAPAPIVPDLRIDRVIPSVQE